MSTLNDKLNLIKDARDDIQSSLAGKGQIVGKDIRDYAEAIDNIVSGGGDVKLFETVEEMQADPNPSEGDLAVIYREEIQPVTEESEFDNCMFPNEVVLDEAFTGRISGRFNAIDGGRFDGNVDMSASRFRFSGYGDEVVRITYTSSDGITYTRTDGGEELQEFGTVIKYEPMEPWNDVFGNFMKIGGNYFEGLYTYGDTSPDDLVECKKLSNAVDDTKAILIPENIINLSDNSISCGIFISAIQADTDKKYNYDYYTIVDGYVVVTSLLFRVVRNGSGVYKLGVNNKNATSSYNYRVIHIVNGEIDSDFTYQNINVNDWSVIAEASNFNWNSANSPSTLPDINNCYYCVIARNKVEDRKVIEIEGDFPADVLNGNISYINFPLTFQQYNVAKVQLDTTKDYVYEKTFYGKNGVESGNLINNISSDFTDTTSEIYSKAQAYYDTLTPRALTDQDKTIDKNIQIIPCKSDGTPLLDTSSVTDMSSMFSGCSSLTTIPQLDTSNVTNMSSVFYNCSSLTTIPLIDTSSVTNMGNMFYGCTSLTTIPLIDTGSATTMSSVFYSCSSLETVPQLNTSNVTNMNSMFSQCTSLTTIPLINTSSATNMQYMFSGCTSLISIPQLNTANVTNMMYMFSNCSSLTTVPLLDTSNVNNMNSMFSRCSSLDNTSLNNILAMCASATSVYTKTLSNTGLTQEQATTCQSLSNYSAFTAAGWTTGY